MKSIDNRGEKSSSDSEGMNKTEYQNRKKIVENIEKTLLFPQSVFAFLERKRYLAF